MKSVSSTEPINKNRKGDIQMYTAADISAVSEQIHEQEIGFLLLDRSICANHGALKWSLH